MLDYTDGPTMEDYGFIHEDELPDLENIKDHLKGVVEAVYKTGNVFMMESCLDELCGELGVSIDKGAPVLEKKGHTNHLQYHLGYQRAQIDQMTWGLSCSA